MSGKIRNTAVLLSLAAGVCAGCTHYAAFPELEETRGVLSSDSQNAAYDDSSSLSGKEKTVVAEPLSKLPKPKAQPVTKVAQPSEKKIAVSAPEAVKVAPKPTAKKAKDLSRPDPKVNELDVSDNSFVVPSKTTPVVIEDMDLTEMDASAGNTKVLKPVSETKTIVPVKKEIRELKKAPKPQSAEPSVFYLAETVHFNNGGSTVDGSYYGSLRKVVQEAKRHNGKIIVQGFASSRTRNTDIVTHKMTNLKVSTKRAENVAALLIKYGMPKNRVITEGLSDSRPVYQEVMPEGERMNRRAEVYISY